MINGRGKVCADLRARESTMSALARLQSVNGLLSYLIYWKQRASTLRPAGTAQAGPGSCDPGHKRSWPWNFFTADLLNAPRVLGEPVNAPRVLQPERPHVR